MLEHITYPGGYLNRDQWESIRAGDWWCETCPSNGRGARKKGAYYWASEVVETGETREPSPLTSDSSMNMEPSNSPPRYVAASSSSETATKALTAEERTLLQDLARGCRSTGPEMVAIAKAIRICDVSSPVPAEAPNEAAFGVVYDAMIAVQNAILDSAMGRYSLDAKGLAWLKTVSRKLSVEHERLSRIRAARSTPTEATNGE